MPVLDVAMLNEVFYKINLKHLMTKLIHFQFIETFSLLLAVE